MRKQSSHSGVNHLGQLRPRSLKQALQALLSVGLPSGMVIFVLSAGEGSDPASALELSRNARQQTSVVLKMDANAAAVDSRPVTEITSVQTQSVATQQPVVQVPRSSSTTVEASHPRVPHVSVSNLPQNIEVETASVDMMPPPASVSESRLSPDQQVLREIDTELSTTPANATRLTGMLERLTTASDPKILNATIDKVLSVLDDPRQRWQTDGDHALLTQALIRLLEKVDYDRERVFARSDDRVAVDPDAYTEQAFERQLLRVDSVRRQALVTLAQNRLDEVFVLANNAANSGFGAVFGNNLFKVSVHYVRVLRENADVSTFTLQDARLRCLLIDMHAQFSRDPALSVDAQEVAMMRAELDGLVRR